MKQHERRLILKIERTLCKAILGRFLLLFFCGKCAAQYETVPQNVSVPLDEQCFYGQE